MSNKEETFTENNSNVYIDALIKDLQLFVEYTLIPGDIQPAIYWLSLYRTIDLKLILNNLCKKYKNYKNNRENIQELDRVTTMKEILLYYYPDCAALKDNCKPSLSN